VPGLVPLTRIVVSPALSVVAVGNGSSSRPPSLRSLTVSPSNRLPAASLAVILISDVALSTGVAAAVMVPPPPPLSPSLCGSSVTVAVSVISPFAAATVSSYDPSVVSLNCTAATPAASVSAVAPVTPMALPESTETVAPSTRLPYSSRAVTGIRPSS